MPIFLSTHIFVPSKKIEMSCLKLLLTVVNAMLVLLQTCNSQDVYAHGGTDTIQLGASITGNQTIISKNGTFELGFFSPNGTCNNWYIGIWYVQIPAKTVIWVANRKAPLKNTPGALNLSTDGHLRLFDLEGRSIWSSNHRVKAARATMLDSGNFIMVAAHDTSNENIVWESFKHPTDTWLPGIKQWKGLQLRSWRTSWDPTPGLFSFGMDPSPESKQILLFYNRSITYWYSGQWTGDHFSDLPELVDQKMVTLSFVTVSAKQSYLIFELDPQIATAKARLVLDMDGQLRMYFWVEETGWNIVWSAPADGCNVYGVCGDYGACNNKNTEVCTCLEGFSPKNKRVWDSQQWWASGCVRGHPTKCRAMNGTKDGFLQVTDKSLSIEQSVLYPQEDQTVETCQATCLNNCSCTAFTVSTDSSSSFCKLWFGELLNARDSSDGSSVFIRLAALDLDKHSSIRTRRIREICISVAAALACFIAVLGLLFVARRLRRSVQPAEKVVEDETVAAFLRMFSYKELRIATEDFKHKLGTGAFGSVYRGCLSDNTSLVAVKKLEGSEYGEKQFRAEISTLGSIQHVNLVRLRGFCAEKSKRLLVYEYMPYGSLDSFLFSRDLEGKVLNWKARFQIAVGAARGLVYLHEECRDRIIHCDVKPENILLDVDFSPKVGDFGMAKVVGRDFSHVLTTARGTRGYLAPEWISGLPITPKVDVYSFGMTLLEIISGRRNLELIVQDSSQYYFPFWAATQIYGGNTISIVEEGIAEDGDIEEVRRASIVALLCIENDEEARPNMRQVVLMLEGKMEPQISQIQSPILMNKQEDRSDTSSCSYS